MKVKINSRVKVIGYTDDKYNPHGIEGTVVSIDGEYNKIIVLLDNGIRNSYNEKNLELV